MPITKKSSKMNENLKEMYNKNSANLGLPQTDLVKKWEKQLAAINEAYDGKIEDHKLLTTAILLENTDRYLKNVRRMNEATQVGDTSFFKRFAINMLSAVTPSLIAEDIVSVQPMLSRVGEIRYLRVMYGSNKAPVQAGTELFGQYHAGDYTQHTYTSDQVDGESFVGDGSAVNFDLAWTPLIPGTITGNVGTDALTDDGNGVVKLAGVAAGTVNYATGRITFSSAPAASAEVVVNYAYDNMTAPTQVPELNLKIVTSPIMAKSRKLKALFSMDAAYDLSNDFGMTMSAELQQYAAAQLKSEIDQEVILDLYNGASAPSVTWNMYAPTGVSTVDHYNSFRIKLTEAGNNIYTATQLASANFYIVGENGATVLESLPAFESAGNLNPKGAYLTGTIGGKPIYKTPSFGSNAFLCGYKGDSLFDAGYVYSPYMPIMSSMLLTDATFTSSQGYATSYGKKMTNGNFYAKGNITNVQDTINVNKVN